MSKHNHNDFLNVLAERSHVRSFLVGLDRDRSGRGRDTLTIHASANTTTPEQKRSILSTLKQQSKDVRLVFRRHSSRSIMQAKSLEGFIAPFHHEQFLADPTGVFTRAHKLVEFARKARRELGGDLSKLLWNSPNGVLFVVLDKRVLKTNDNAAPLSRIATIERSLRSLLGSIFGASDANYIRSIKVSVRKPRALATPIDRQSYRPVENWLEGSTFNSLRLSALAAFFGLGSYGAVQAQPLNGDYNAAVSGVNTELGLLGGARSDENGVALVEGAITSPLGQQFGTRFDGAAGSLDGEFFGGVGGHLFWRDPSRAMLGIAGGYVHTEADNNGATSSDFGAIAAEGELYFDRLTISALAGHEFAEKSTEEGFLGRLDLEWYLNDDLMLDFGLETNPSDDLVKRVSLEYRPGFDALPGLTFFAEGALGDGDYSRAMGGIRLYFGQSETLKDRHRHDTFRSHLFPTRMMDSVARYGD